MTAGTAIVVTTIQEPTDSMRVLAHQATAHRLQWIVIGDQKGPASFTLAPAELVSLEEQRALSFKIARLLPEKHYARKNLGYLLAISRGCDCIYETDDDNAPTEAWQVRTLQTEVRKMARKSDASWVNVYSAYTTEFVWPRGLPLNRARQGNARDFEIAAVPVRATAPIQQGLVNGSPDVDAIWRLMFDREFSFEDFPNISLPRGLWSPFNSQNTWWWEEAFPLLYLPSYCSFRMTDIWRSLVAQRCLWELGYELEFHHADVRHARNEHDLMHDFEQEIVGYLRNDEIRRILESCDLRFGKSHLKDNLLRCYEALVRADVILTEELALVGAWLEDCPEIVRSTDLSTAPRGLHV
jgi:STELLO glycosyltransferases